MVSSLAKSVRLSLEEAFPNSLIKDEEYISYKGHRLFFDFYMPSLNIYIEVQGRQHREFVEHFHGTAAAFRASKLRDRLKVEWCELNDYTLIRIHDTEIPINAQDLLVKISEAMIDD